MVWIYCWTAKKSFDLQTSLIHHVLGVVSNSSGTGYVGTDHRSRVYMSPGLSVWPKFNAHTTSLPSLKHFDPLKYFWGDCRWLADEPVIGLAITWSHLSGHVFQILKMTFHPSYISDQPKKHPRAPWKVKKSKNDSVGQCKKGDNCYFSLFKTPFCPCNRI